MLQTNRFSLLYSAAELNTIICYMKNSKLHEYIIGVEVMRADPDMDSGEEFFFVTYRLSEPKPLNAVVQIISDFTFAANDFVKTVN